MQLGMETKQIQTQTLSQEMRQGLVLLQRPILELRAELQRLMMANPAIEEVEWDFERPMSRELPQEHQSGSVSEKPLDFAPDHQQAVDTLGTDDADRDQYLQNMENYEPAADNGSWDPDANTKRDLMFNRQVKEETLQEHLAKQVPLSNIPKEDHYLADILIGRIEDDGTFGGALADIQMTTGKSEKELLAILGEISQFDPVGCGGRNLPETLLYQMEKLDDSPWEDEVRELIAHHWDDLMANRKGLICAALKITPQELEKVLAELPKLSRKPGLSFASHAVNPGTYVEPEVFLKKTAAGKWKVYVPERHLPDIRISKRFLKLLEDPNATSETKAYVREKIEAANALRDAIAERQETIRKIAQTIVDVQKDVFDKRSLAALKPLTQDQVAKVVDVHNSTVSRTVNDKYMATPLGTIELRKFFVAGLAKKNGEDVISNVAVIEEIKKIIEAEDKTKPLSDQKIADLLKEKEIVVARRTVAKYRESLHIPGTAERKQTD